MIRVDDTPPPYPMVVRPGPTIAAAENFDQALQSLGWFHFDYIDVGRNVLYVKPEHYHLARAMVYYFVPMFVRVDVIPMEFMS